MNTPTEIELDTEGRAIKILAQPVSMGQFAEFTRDTGYRTYFEQYDGPNWRDNAIVEKPISIEDVLKSSELSSLPATELTKIDADAFLRWLGRGEIPSIEQLVLLIEKIEKDAIVQYQNHSYEIVDSTDYGLSSELGFCCLFTSTQSVSSLNRFSKGYHSLRSYLEGSLAEIKIDSLISSTFRYVVK